MAALVLLSGGLDSAVVLSMCELPSAIGFDYGQKHRIELERARAIAGHYKVPFEVMVLPAMPRVDDVVFAGRNLVFAATAIALAQARDFSAIAVGCNASDWVRFPDCRPRFWSALETCAEAYGIKVLTPLLHSTKRDVVEFARKQKVPIDLTWSCYDPRDGEPCRECLACKTREDALCS